MRLRLLRPLLALALLLAASPTSARRAAPTPARGAPGEPTSFAARVEWHAERLARRMAATSTQRGQRFYALKDPTLAEAVVERLLKHPRFAYGGGFRRPTMWGRGDKAIFRTRSGDKLELLRRLSWRNHSIDLWATGRGTIVYGGTNAAVEMGIAQRDGRFTYLIGSSNSVGGYEIEAKHGRLLLHTHPTGTSRAISEQDLSVFRPAARGMTSQTLELGRNVQLIASYPAAHRDRPAKWFRDLDIYLWAEDLPQDHALLPSHPIYREVMRLLRDSGFSGFKRPRGMIVNPASSESVAFVDR